MSQENVEVVRRNFEAWNAGDMDAFRKLCDPEVVMYHVIGEASPSTVRPSREAKLARQGFEVRRLERKNATARGALSGGS